LAAALDENRRLLADEHRFDETRFDKLKALAVRPLRGRRRAHPPLQETNV